MRIFKFLAAAMLTALALPALAGVSTEFDTEDLMASNVESTWPDADWDQVGEADMEWVGTELTYTMFRRSARSPDDRFSRHCSVSQVSNGDTWFNLNDGFTRLLDRDNPQLQVIVNNDDFVKGDDDQLQEWLQMCADKTPPIRTDILDADST